MNDTLRVVVAGAVSAVVTAAVLTASPVLADQAKQAGAKITSAQIKNGTIKKKDLSAEVTGSLAKADSALQSVPDGSVTTGKLANNAVTSPKIADNAVGSSEIANDAVGSNEIATDAVGNEELAANSVTGAEVVDGSIGGADLGPNSVGSNQIANGSLQGVDLGSARGANVIDFPNVPIGTCVVSGAITPGGGDLTNDIILLENPPTVVGNIQLAAREQTANDQAFEIVACNNGNAAFDPPSTGYSWVVIEN